MVVASLVLVETSQAGNLGAAMRVAANFGVPRIDLVRPRVDPASPEVVSWARGADRHLELRSWDRVGDAVSEYRTLAATASGRGRDSLPTVSPPEAARHIGRRGAGDTALMFGNETSGLRRDQLDRADMVIRVPTSPSFPVLNLTQSIAILLACLALTDEPVSESAPRPASAGTVAGLMSHLDAALADIGFTDPGNPDRILRKLRRLIGRAGVTDNEVKILRGICRQMQWAAATDPGVVADAASQRRRSAGSSSSPPGSDDHES